MAFVLLVPDVKTCAYPQPALGWGGTGGAWRGLNSVEEPLVLAKVLPPFVFPCHFTHQLGREGPRKPLQPAWGKRDRVPSAARAEDRLQGKEGSIGSNVRGLWWV